MPHKVTSNFYNSLLTFLKIFISGYGPVAAVKTIDNDPGKAKTKLIFQEFAINNIDKLK